MSQKWKSNCLKFSSVLIFLLFLQVGFAQSKGRKNDKEFGLERFPGLDGMISHPSSQKVLGKEFVTLIWRDTVVFKKEIGDFNAKTEAPLAGASQLLTTALILILVDEGKLSLDDKVIDFIPIYSTYGKNYITLRHCLSHYTGIQGGQKLLEGKIESLETEAASYAKKEIQTNPGTEFRYSNIGMMLAGRVAEVVMKKKFDQLIKQKLFNPMGMTRTTFSTLDGSGINPATGARSSAIDYVRFLAMLLNNGKFNNKQILSEGAIKEIRKIHASIDAVRFAPKATTGLSYALGGWAAEEKDGTATALAGNGLFGPYPVVDWCRGYAMIVLPKELLDEQKNQPYLQMKGAVDEEVRSKCNE